MKKWHITRELAHVLRARKLIARIGNDLDSRQRAFRASIKTYYPNTGPIPIAPLEKTDEVDPVLFEDDIKVQMTPEPAQITDRGDPGEGFKFCPREQATEGSAYNVFIHKWDAWYPVTKMTFTAHPNDYRFRKPVVEPGTLPPEFEYCEHEDAAYFSKYNPKSRSWSKWEQVVDRDSVPHSNVVFCRKTALLSMSGLSEMEEALEKEAIMKANRAITGDNGEGSEHLEEEHSVEWLRSNCRGLLKSNNMLIAKVEELTATLERTTTTLNETHNKLNERQEEVHALNGYIAKWKKSYGEAYSRANDNAKAVLKLTAELEEKVEALKNATEAIEHLKDKCARHVYVEDQIKARLDEKDAELATWKAQFEAMAAENARIREQLQKDACAVDDWKKAYNELFSGQIETQRHIDLREEHAKLKAERDTLLTENAKLREQLKQDEDEYEGWRKAFNDAQTKLKAERVAEVANWNAHCKELESVNRDLSLKLSIARDIIKDVRGRVGTEDTDP